MTTVGLNSSISGLVSAPASKSALQRLLICSALSEGDTAISACGSGEDVRTVARALSALGAGIEATVTGFIVKRIQPPAAAVINCRESGAALRFLLPLASALGVKCSFSGEGRLGDRPILPLIRAMEANGAAFSGGVLPFTVSGTLRPGEFRLPAGVSSQFLSGLLMALPLLEGDSRIILEGGPLVSAPYVEMTLRTMALFGVHAVRDGSAYHIKGGQGFVSPGRCSTPGDWSSAASLLCAGAVGGGVEVSGLQRDGSQADEAVLELLSALGADTGFSHGTAFAGKNGPLRAIDADLSGCPDLMPVLAVTAAFASGKSVFTGVGRLRFKESDRPDSVVRLILELGGRARAEGDRLTVWGTGLRPGAVSAGGDHRIAMAAAVAAAGSGGPVKIEGGESVSKSYPGFFSDLKLLGYEINIEGR